MSYPNFKLRSRGGVKLFDPAQPSSSQPVAWWPNSRSFPTSDTKCSVFVPILNSKSLRFLPRRRATSTRPNGRTSCKQPKGKRKYPRVEERTYSKLKQVWAARQDYEFRDVCTTSIFLVGLMQVFLCRNGLVHLNLIEADA